MRRHPTYQAVRVRRLSPTIENEAHPRADRFPRTEARRDNADDVPSPMMIDKALHHNISDVFVPREDAEAACKLVRDGRQDQVKNRATIDGHPHNTSPPLLTSS